MLLLLVADWVDQLSDVLGQVMAANPWVQPVALTGFVVVLAVLLIFGRRM